MNNNELNELYKLTDKMAEARIKDVDTARDGAEEGIRDCLERIGRWVNEYMQPYTRMLTCDGRSAVSVDVAVADGRKKLYLLLVRKSVTCLYMDDVPDAWSLEHLEIFKKNQSDDDIVANWPLVKETIRKSVQRALDMEMRDLESRLMRGVTDDELDAVLFGFDAETLRDRSIEEGWAVLGQLTADAVRAAGIKEDEDDVEGQER